MASPNPSDYSPTYCATVIVTVSWGLLGSTSTPVYIFDDRPISYDDAWYRALEQVMSENGGVPQVPPPPPGMVGDPTYSAVVVANGPCPG